MLAIKNKENFTKEFVKYTFLIPTNVFDDLEHYCQLYEERIEEFLLYLICEYLYSTEVNNGITS